MALESTFKRPFVTWKCTWSFFVELPPSPILNSIERVRKEIKRNYRMKFNPINDFSSTNEAATRKVCQKKLKFFFAENVRRRRGKLRGRFDAHHIERFNKSHRTDTHRIGKKKKQNNRKLHNFCIKKLYKHRKSAGKSNRAQWGGGRVFWENCNGISFVRWGLFVSNVMSQFFGTICWLWGLVHKWRHEHI